MLKGAKIMGILNLTPDSFSDGGKFNELQSALSRAEEIIAQGADIIDIGGESTGPGSADVTIEEELKRIKPVIDLIAENKFTEKTIFSIDTYKSQVAEYALKHGFTMVNDVTALRGDSKMIEVLLKYEPYIILMYSKDATARTTKEIVEYDDVIATIKTFLLERIATLVTAGFPEEKIIIDPGMGAFVSGEPKYSFEIIKRLEELKVLSYPILVGISRKSCLNSVHGGLDSLDGKSVDWSVKAIQNGAGIIRIHNVQALKKALRQDRPF